MINPQDKVSSFLTANGTWDTRRLELFFPHWVIQGILCTKLNREGGADTFYWRGATDGNFSVKSAYDLLMAEGTSRPIKPWARLWKLHTPEKVKFFLWQVYHERLPTNQLRVMRGLTMSGECPFECQREETILHILRDCEIAREVWTPLVHFTNRFAFFSSSLQVWLQENMTNAFGFGKTKKYAWEDVFGIVCWSLWRNRCTGVMDGKRLHQQDIIHQCMRQLQELENQDNFTHQVSDYTTNTESSWTPPTEPFIRLDVDGSVRDDQRAACGGVFRNHKGEWTLGFQLKLGAGNASMAEILAIRTGLWVSKQMGYQKVVLYSDSIEALRLILHEHTAFHPLLTEIREIRDCIYSNMEVSLLYSPRGNLRCADVLARSAHQSSEGIKYLYQPPVSCDDYLREDSKSIYASLPVTFGN